MGNKNFKVDSVTAGAVMFTNGYKLVDVHRRECCENVYANWLDLEDTTIFDETFEDIELGFREGYGVRINEQYGVACYDIQNGYYSDNLVILLKDDKGEVVKKWDVAKSNALIKIYD